jgi:hypothetical protein
MVGEAISRAGSFSRAQSGQSRVESVDSRRSDPEPPASALQHRQNKFMGKATLTPKTQTINRKQAVG